MTHRPDTGLYAPIPREEVVADLTRRARERLVALPVGRRDALLEDALYHERKRMLRAHEEGPEDALLERLAKALVRGSTSDRIDVGTELVATWAEEIHGRFSMPAYRFATSIFPPALAGLLSAFPQRLRDLPRLDLDASRRIQIDGDTALIRDLVREATVILAPTHVSNLDSPIIGLALLMAGLPPFQYGAGLNLFSNPLLGWWMRRLGAYTVDRTKEAALYKDVLKDYSVYQLTRRNHSLFFPGGTRSRSGAIETRVKKGLLGTGVLAWQEMLAAGRPDPDVYVVPLTLSFSLSLEANTLIEDFLADEGKQRYIISDDESAQPRRVVAFAQRVLSLDASIVCRFGTPLDVLGTPVPSDPAARAQASQRRRQYVTDRQGKVERDDQRDRIYTERLSKALIADWPKHATVMSTHLVAWVAWQELCRSLGTTDPFRIVRAPLARRRLPRAAFMASLAHAQASVLQGVADGRWHAALFPTAAATMDDAINRFGRYHTTRAVAVRGKDVVIEDPRLALYYGNRLAFAGLSLPPGPSEVP